ncbi:MAG: DNA adenine methylase [Ruminococcus flavefaciens]|nr:DNA adenine methylase [Ruminococcus flavefaciens]
MRYLGNKESILGCIEELLRDKGLIKSRLTFFDAFCGSGSVADYFKQYYDIIINDNLKWSTVYTRGRICAPICTFEKLGFDPIEFLNSNNESIEGFMFKNYSPGGSERMYFTAENAGRIDYFRQVIEQWKIEQRINEDEYCYLLACLIESVSDVSNTAGVYGAFLKKWDSRALKEIIFDRVDSCENKPIGLSVYNAKIEDIIEDVECDILYLDPPYTQNQYGTQYHLLETLILDDEPTISKITGSRSTAPMRSDWSKEFKVNILFDRILAKTKAKYIVLSYNNDGFMSKEYIEAALKRYGRAETYKCKKIAYKKYQNWKSQNENEHFEYLFFVERKKNEDIIFESPLNYIGSKSKIIKDIKLNMPDNVGTFIDAFGGGFNVGINIDECDTVVYNDLNHIVKELIESFKEKDTYQYLMFVKKIRAKFGLEKGNAEAYYGLRDYYNSLAQSSRDPRILYTLILYGYQQQIRFNSQHNFNNPVGVRWFNDKVLEKMISFSRVIKEKNVVFLSSSYEKIKQIKNEKVFVYMDPPYTLTTGSYNDGKRGFDGWNEELENNLFLYANTLTKRNIPFMLSYVVQHKGKVNQKLLKWIEDNNYKLIELGEVIGISGSRRKEVFITNYELL